MSPNDILPLINEVRGTRPRYEIYDAQSEFLAADSRPRDSIWNFGYYRHYPGPGKFENEGEGRIGGSPVTSTDPVLEGRSVHYSRELSQTINNIRRATGAEKVNIVAFSQGGVVARAYISWLGGDRFVNKLIMIDTPNHGLDPVFAQAMRSDIPFWDFPDWMEQGEVREMDNGARIWEESSYLYHLNRAWSQVRSSVSYAVVKNLFPDPIEGANPSLDIFFTVPPHLGLLTDSQAIQTVRNFIFGGTPGNCGSGGTSPQSVSGYSSPTPPILLLLEDGANASDWQNVSGDLDIFGVVSQNTALNLDFDGNQRALEIGGADEGWTWVGEIRKEIPAYLRDWSGARRFFISLIRGPYMRGGQPSVTLRLRDEAGRQYELHRSWVDQCLPWQGGGSRIVRGLGTPGEGATHTFELPAAPDGCAVQDPRFDWNHVASLSVELRRSLCFNPDGSTYACQPDPDNVQIPFIGLELEPSQWVDADSDDVHDWVDDCLSSSNPDQRDSDHDSLGDACDNCPHDFNPLQEDLDRDARGDACQRHVDIMLEDFEDLSDCMNLDGNLDLFEPSLDAIEGGFSLRIGGTDEGGSWIGAVEKWIDSRDWTTSDLLKVWMKVGPTRRGGNPAVTFKAMDDTGREIVFYRTEDLSLPWSGGGWRTLVSNNDWEEYRIPIRHETGFNWTDVRKIRIELRKNVFQNSDGSWSWEGDPHDLLVDSFILDPPVGVAEAPADGDGDGIPEGSDNCPVTANPDQFDADFNGIGDACEIPVPVEPDADGDGIGDNSDPDVDNDGIENGQDLCPGSPGFSFSDSCPYNDFCSDGSETDYEGDECNHNDCADRSTRDDVDDPCNHDEDGDTVPDEMDAFPRDSTRTLDQDHDGWEDAEDAFPQDSEEWIDTNGNGIGNNTDPDSWFAGFEEGNFSGLGAPRFRYDISIISDPGRAHHGLGLLEVENSNSVSQGAYATLRKWFPAPAHDAACEGWFRWPSIDSSSSSHQVSLFYIGMTDFGNSHSSSGSIFVRTQYQITEEGQFQLVLRDPTNVMPPEDVILNQEVRPFDRWFKMGIRQRGVDGLLQLYFNDELVFEEYRFRNVPVQFLVLRWSGGVGMTTAVDDLACHWETDFDQDGLPNGLDDDDDNDELTNEEEIELGTDRWNPDSDGNGLEDSIFRPDLVIREAGVVAGRPGRLRVVIENIGTAPAEGPILIGTRPDWYTKPGFNSTFLVVRTGQRVEPGESVDLTFFDQPADSWQITVDPTGWVEELNENNNSFVLSR